MLVTTGQNLFVTADPAVAQTILTRRKEFIQSPISNKVLGFLGANILTVSSPSPPLPSSESHRLSLPYIPYNVPQGHNG